MQYSVVPPEIAYKQDQTPGANKNILSVRQLGVQTYEMCSCNALILSLSLLMVGVTAGRSMDFDL